VVDFVTRNNPEIHILHKVEGNAAIVAVLQVFVNILSDVKEGQDKIMATVADAAANLTTLETSLAEALALLAKIWAELQAAIAAGADPAALQSLADRLAADTAKINTAVAAAPDPQP
jgi:hypothetical protein